MTTVLATCVVCGKVIKTNRGDCEYDKSVHIEKEHPEVYADAVAIKTEIDALKSSFFKLTGCRNTQMFPKRK